MNKISGKSVNGYKINAIFNATENGLELNSFEVEPTEDIKEKIYREKELSYRILDATRHIANYIYSNEVDSVDEIKELQKESTAILVAKSFLEIYDCNRSENDQWESIISNYYNDVIRK